MNETGNEAGKITQELPISTTAIQAADEAACRLDGMFRDLFTREDRHDLIAAILRAAQKSTAVADFWEPAT